MRLNAPSAALGRLRVGRWLLGIGGVVLTIAVVRQLGAHAVATQLGVLGPALPWVLLISGLRYPLQTAGWRLVLLPDDRPPWPVSLRATLAGNAMSYLTFAGPVAGEPARAFLLQGHTPMSVGVAAGGVERAMYTIAGTLLTAVGFAIAAVRLGHGAQVRTVALIAAAAAAAAGVAYLLARSRHDRRATRAPAVGEGWRGVLRSLGRDRRRTVAGVAALGAGQHALLLLEAWVILRAIGGGADLGTIFVFEGMTKMVNSLGTFVPAGAGVAEGGSALLAAALGVGAGAGLSLALVRRARALFWGAVGMTMVAGPRAVAPRLNPAPAGTTALRGRD